MEQFESGHYLIQAFNVKDRLSKARSCVASLLLVVRPGAPSSVLAPRVGHSQESLSGRVSAASMGVNALRHVELSVWTYIHTYRQTDRQTDRETDRQTAIQRYRRTYRHTYIHLDCCSQELGSVRSPTLHASDHDWKGMQTERR